jgi:hypothetical protein
LSVDSGREDGGNAASDAGTGGGDPQPDSCSLQVPGDSGSGALVASIGVGLAIVGAFRRALARNEKRPR